MDIFQHKVSDDQQSRAGDNTDRRRRNNYRQSPVCQRFDDSYRYPLTVEVSVTAKDSGGQPLTYHWRSTDGTIQDVNANSTSWTLPDGPGLHFAYVLVSNGVGGYTDRRIAVNTDSIGTPSTTPSPVSMAPPPAAAPQGDVYRSFVIWGVFAPDIRVYLQDDLSGTVYPPSGTVLTGLTSEFLIPGVPPLTSYSAHCSVDGGQTFSGCTSLEPYNRWPPPPLPLAAATDYASGQETQPAISGSLVLQDGALCGAVDEFFGVQVTGTATLLDNSGKTLAGPVRLNAYGQYSLPYNASASSVLLQCENAAPVSVAVINPKPFMVLPQASVSKVSAPVISAMSATLNGTEVGTFLPPPSGFPSDFYPSGAQFLAEKGLDTRVGACQYYKAIGAVASCDASGNPSGAISFEDWKRTVKIDNYASGAPLYTATYVNKVDLNLTRNHHSISYGANQTGAYVCNHLGPPTLDSPQSDIDTAINKAVSGENLVACVAMDNNVTPGVNVDSHGVSQPFTRFLIFGPGGQLLPSINLDGRQEKFVPGTCVVCHGGDHYAGKFPEDGTGTADVGGHFLPYDAGNFEFSSQPGLTEADQEGAIYNLNQNVLKAAPTVAEQELIGGWYAGGTTLNKTYLPSSWPGQNASASNFYQSVYARSCRTCHVAMVEGFNFDHYPNLTPGGHFYRESSPGSALYESMSSNSLRRGHSMPNSLVTFNRFWRSAGTSTDQPALLKQFLLSDPVIPETTGTVMVIDGVTDTTSTIPAAGLGPLAVDSAANKIYVPNHASNTINVIDGATGAVTASIPVGTGPFAVAMNPVTNKIYVANDGSDSITVIDGVSDTVTATIPLSIPPYALSVNSATNKVYVAAGTNSSFGVTVIDGASSTVTTTVPMVGFPLDLAINSNANRVFVVDNAGNLTVINGVNDSVIATIPLGGDAHSITVNSVTNNVYLATSSTQGNFVTVINGTTDTITASIPGIGYSGGLAVDPATNKIYVPNNQFGSLTVINGATNTVTATVSVGAGPFAVALNPGTNRIYVLNFLSGNVTVIDGAADTAIATIPVGLNPSAVSVNPTTNKVYVDVE